MTSITTSYSDLITKEATDYSKSTPAAALFYWGDGSARGLRVESIELMKEFFDNVDFGRDPQGLLFYNESSDFKNNIDVPYKVYYNNETPKALKVDFYYELSDDAPFAIFLAKDDANIDSRLLSDGKGQWRDLKTGTCCTRIEKISVQKKVTLTLEPIGRKVTFDVVDNTLKAGFDTHGVMYFPSLAALSGSNTIANYNDDRIIFYDAQDHKKLVAVFFSTEGEKLKIDNHASTQPVATWVNI